MVAPNYCFDIKYAINIEINKNQIAQFVITIIVTIKNYQYRDN